MILKENIIKHEHSSSTNEGRPSSTNEGKPSSANDTHVSSSNRLDILLVFLLSLTLPLFFYKLGQSSLVSFDEAWYADIARNILKTGDVLNLYWNGKYFTDHPVAGYWIIALGQAIFGINEFGSRFGSAILGFFTLVILYFLGKELFNNFGSFASRLVGFLSAIALASSPWFLFRARSGNLDATLTFFFVLTFFLALKSVKNKKYLIFFTFSLIFLLLTKSVVPFTIIPVLLVIFWGSRGYKFKDLLVPGIILITFIGSWFYAQLDNHDHFIQRYLSIGLPGIEAKASFKDNLSLMKEYLHNGIGKWFWPGVISIILGPLLLQKRFFILTIFSISFFAPFLFSQKGHIWHLLPLHPFMILAFFGFFYVILNWLLTKFFFYVFPYLLSLSPLKKKFKVSKKIIAILTAIPIILVCVYYSFIQIRRVWYEFVDIPAFISDEAILSKEAGKFKEKFYIDGDFGPTAVFYSGKKVEQIRNERLAELFKNETSFVLITNDWRLTQMDISNGQYKLIKKDRDKILILKQ
jgi:4-amino-4-deoxy-L-arabinose transferase-like glycosyltransferase